MNKVFERNRIIFQKLSNYLNFDSKLITKEMIDEIEKLGFTEEESFCYLLASYFDLSLDDYESKVLFNEYIKKIIKKLEVSEYINNPYYQNIRCFNNIKINNCELKYDEYAPYEGFVYDDIEKHFDGKQLPKIGFFSEKFKYPAIYENDRLWMSVTPNEINTMKEAINEAKGNVLTYGLGLGYFAYMVSLKEEVNSIVIVEKNEDIISLFTNNILPLFKNKEKITIINEDAFKFAETTIKNYQFEFIFADLWHDVSDGLDMYLKLKKYECNQPKAKHMYWIEKSIKCYL